MVERAAYRLPTYFPVFCAWCRRRKIDDETWVEAPEPFVPVSHGICPSCANAMRSPLRARARDHFVLAPIGEPCPSAARSGCAGRGKIADPHPCPSGTVAAGSPGFECFCCADCEKVCGRNS